MATKQRHSLASVREVVRPRERETGMCVCVERGVSQCHPCLISQFHLLAIVSSTSCTCMLSVISFHGELILLLKLICLQPGPNFPPALKLWHLCICKYTCTVSS